MKLIQNEEMLAQLATMGIDSKTYFIIGIIEILSLVLFIIPLSGTHAYLGGAIATHLTHEQSLIMPVSIQVLIWITAFIRFPVFLSFDKDLLSNR